MKGADLQRAVQLVLNGWGAPLLGGPPATQNRNPGHRGSQPALCSPPERSNKDSSTSTKGRLSGFEQFFVVRCADLRRVGEARRPEAWAPAVVAHWAAIFFREEVRKLVGGRRLWGGLP